MDEWETVLMRVQDWFRKNPQTNWGKNQIISKIDEMRDKIKDEKKA